MKVEPFSLFATVECGQCFHYIKKNCTDYVLIGEDSVCEATWDPFTSEIDLETDNLEYWKRYLALDEDYKTINNYLHDHAEITDDAYLRQAILYGEGLRIMHQPLFEVCCSFILSQQNNIPRIKKLVFAMSELASREIYFKDEKFKLFPTYEDLKDISVEKYKSMGMGYRAEYVYDFVKGWPELSKKLSGNNMVKDKELLLSCSGIGEKVANCILLFGLGYMDAFPIDVWIKGIIQKEYTDKGKSLNLPNKYAGIMQQYMFFEARTKN